MAQRFKFSIAADVLRNGGIVAYPTEAVFGLGCDPHNVEALNSLLRIKQRPAELGLILISHSIDIALRYIQSPSNDLVDTLKQSWPGPTTFIVPATGLHPLVTGGRDTVALRVSSHPVCRELCAAFGDVVVSTSANISGRPPATSAWQIRKRFGAQVDYIVGGSIGNNTKPTRIIDARTSEVLRAD